MSFLGIYPPLSYNKSTNLTSEEGQDMKEFIQGMNNRLHKEYIQIESKILKGVN